MTLPSLEWLLVLGVVGFYLQDSALLLHYDEIVVTRRGRRWAASTGSASQIGGRYLYLPDPLRPASPLFRIGWMADPARSPREHWAGLDHYLAALERFGPWCRSLWGLLLIALPWLLWRSASPTVMLGLAVAIYLNVLKIGIDLWRYRRVLALSGAQAGSLAFELLCCPPHAINVVRRLCARRGLHGDAIDAARRLLAPAQARELAGRIDERLEMAMDFHGDDARLLAAKQRLEALR